MLPGVALVAEAMEAAVADPALARAIGPAPRLSVVKFLEPVGPGASLDIALRLEARTVAFRIGDKAGRTVATGQFARADSRPRAARDEERGQRHRRGELGRPARAQQPAGPAG